jgi:hypothetical protein
MRREWLVGRKFFPPSVKPPALRRHSCFQDKVKLKFQTWKSTIIIIIIIIIKDISIQNRQAR